MGWTIKELIRIHLEAGFKPGPVNAKFRFRVWRNVFGHKFLIANAKFDTVIIYHFNDRGVFQRYGTEEIKSQAWTRVPREGSNYLNAREVRVDC